MIIIVVVLYQYSLVGNILLRKVSVLVCGKTGSGRSCVMQVVANDHLNTATNSSMKCVKHCPRLVKRAIIGAEWYALYDVSRATENSACSSTKYCFSGTNEPSKSSNGFHLHASNSSSVASDSIDLINIIDTRGHVAFHSTYMLPLTLQTTSKVVILCVINLSEELEKQALPLKECMNAIKSLMDESSVPCKAVFVGTYKDKENECMETREQKCQKIKKMLSDLSVQDDILVKCKGKNDFIFPLNAKHPREEDWQIAIQLRKIIAEKVGDMTNSIPGPTFRLFLALQQQMTSSDKCVARWSECFTIAQQLQFTKKGFEDALKHLDNLNMLFYSPDVLPDLILDQQVFVDKLAELAEYCYHLRQALPPCSCLPSIGKWPKFQHQGIVSDQLLNEFTGHYVAEVFTPKQLMEVMKYHYIAADIGVNEYLMPCILPAEEVSEHKPVSSGGVSPLLLSFENVTPLHGIFSALVCFLISRTKWKLSNGSGFQPHCTSKKVYFYLPGEHVGKVTLSEFSSFLKVEISDSVDSKLYSKLCPQIRHSILNALHNVLSLFEYSNSAKPQEAFLCSASSCVGSSSHPAVVQSDYQTMKCASSVVTQLESKHLHWFASIRGEL